jgi:metallo-beta-lactamase class B
MSLRTVGLLCAIGLIALLGSANITGQSGADAVEVHVAAARAAAGQEHTALFGLCTPPVVPAAQPTTQPVATQPPGPPDRAQWHAEPAKVFDNLYYVGEKNYSAWAVTTSDGIIIVDALYDYSVEDEIANGLPKLGLDPTKIKYVLVSHAHDDHVAGARYLQQRFGARVIMSAADWDLLDTDKAPYPKPKRDLVATDGQRLTLGDTTLTLYLTPGHTLGTISTLIPVKDGARQHLAAEWGGTAFNWMRWPEEYVTTERPPRFWFETYFASAMRFRDLAAKAGADVIISNHPNYDRTVTKLRSLATRGSADPHPYVVGQESVQNYLTVAAECAKAGLLRLK